MKVLITGANGFIGSHLASYFLKQGHKVVGIDNFSTSKQNKEHNDNMQMYNIDLSAYTPLIEQLIQECDVIYHFAASIGVKYFDTDPRMALQNSFNINNVLFPLFEKYNKKVIFSSTSEVYGDRKTGKMKETDSLEIGCPDVLRWGYASQKLTSEFMLKSYTNPSVIVRFFNVTGKGQLPDYGMVLPRFIDKALKGEPLTVYGEGTSVRSFSDIRDIVPVLYHLSITNKYNNEIMNLGSEDNEINMKELAELVIEVTGSKSSIDYIPFEKEFTKNFGEIYRRVPDVTKMKQIYTPRYDLEDIIRSFYE